MKKGIFIASYVVREREALMGETKYMYFGILHIYIRLIIPIQ